MLNNWRLISMKNDKQLRTSNTQQFSTYQNWEKVINDSCWSSHWLVNQLTCHILISDVMRWEQNWCHIKCIEIWVWEGEVKFYVEFMLDLSSNRLLPILVSQCPHDSGSSFCRISGVTMYHGIGWPDSLDRYNQVVA